MTKDTIFQSIRRLAPLALVVTTTLLPATTAAGEPLALQPFSATFQVKYGLLRGTMTLALERSDHGYVYETTLSPAGVAGWFKHGTISERTQLVEVNGTIVPLDYDSTDTIANPTRHTHYAFDQQQGRVTGRYKTQDIDVPLRPGGHNRISAHIALLAALQSNADIATFSVFDRARWRDFRVAINRDQAVKTPAGTFDTVEVLYTQADKDRSWSMHFAQNVGYLPVLLVFREGGKVKSRAQLTEYTTGANVVSASG